MKVFLSALFVVSVVQGTPEFYRIVQRSGDTKLIEDILVDREQNYSLITVGKIEGPSQYKPSVNLHDFTSRYKALKDIETGECFVHASDHVIEQIMDRIDEILKKDYQKKLNEMHFECDKTAEADIKQIAGARIATFCKNYNTYLVTAKPGFGTNEHDVQTRTIYGCGLCFFAACSLDEV